MFNQHNFYKLWKLLIILSRNFVQSWFDEKYSSGRKPTLEDKSSLFSGLLRSSDRCKKEVEEAIKDTLFSLKQKGGYAPSLHAIAYELVHTLGPAVSLDPNVFKNYREQYQSALNKHRDKNVFSDNFQS